MSNEEESNFAKVVWVSVEESDTELKLRLNFLRSLYFLLSARNVYATMMYSIKLRNIDTSGITNGYTTVAQP